MLSLEKAVEKHCSGISGNVKNEDDIVGMSSVDDFSFLHFSGDLEDPIYAFWRLYKAGSLADTCYVVFENVNPLLLWRDLENVFGGVMWGSLFLMKVKSNTKPSVVPSQRRLYLG